MRKRITFGVLSLLTASFLLSQSLVDASKQEQERRDKLKGKNAKVVTNADLKKAKAPAMAGAPEAARPEAQTQAEAAPEAGAAAPAEAPAQTGPENVIPAVGYATSVFPEWFLVENPDSALGPPDDKYAEISETGVLDLDIAVNNGPGDDLAIYSRRPANVLPKEESENQLASYQSNMWWGEFRYAVLGLDSRGEWQEIGLGSGQNPDKFDLGALGSTSRIRIMFKTYSNPYNDGAKTLSLAGQEVTFGIDAVGALH